MGFITSFLKNNLFANAGEVKADSLGIANNIRYQLISDNKAFGLFGDTEYHFGWGKDCSDDHVKIISELESVTYHPHFMVSIHGHSDIVQVNIMPYHTSKGAIPEPGFERAVIREILEECKAAFADYPKRFRIDVEYEILSVKILELTRAETVEQIQDIIDNLYK